MAVALQRDGPPRQGVGQYRARLHCRMKRRSTPDCGAMKAVRRCSLESVEQPADRDDQLLLARTPAEGGDMAGRWTAHPKRPIIALGVDRRQLPPERNQGQGQLQLDAPVRPGGSQIAPGSEAC